MLLPLGKAPIVAEVVYGEETYPLGLLITQEPPDVPSVLTEKKVVAQAVKMPVNVPALGKAFIVTVLVAVALLQPPVPVTV